MHEKCRCLLTAISGLSLDSQVQLYFLIICHYMQKANSTGTVSSVHKHHIMKEVILHDIEACLLYTCRLALVARACHTDVWKAVDLDVTANTKFLSLID